jgi:transcriptional regulator
MTMRTKASVSVMRVQCDPGRVAWTAEPERRTVGPSHPDEVFGSHPGDSFSQEARRWTNRGPAGPSCAHRRVPLHTRLTWGHVLYQPGHRRFEVEEPAALLAELCRHLPATIVTHTVDGFRATILPMLFDPEDGPYGTLRGHWARGNPQWRDVGEDTLALAIFDGPDAYVSPSWYAEKRLTGKVVPTWNYITVQAQGHLGLRHEPEWLLAHVRRLVDRHEQGRQDPWSLDDAPTDYVETQVRAIVGFELRIERLEAKRKLSQNRSADDIAGTIVGLGSASPRERAVADSMLERTKG